MAEELQQDPLHAVASHQKGGIMDFSVMREKKFAMLLLHAIVVSLGFFVPYYYFASVERLASVTGIAFAASAIGSLIGIPTAGALLENGSTTNYLPLQLWTGFVMATAAAIAFILKIMMARHILAKV
ncbi:hypothetical protein BGZ73_006048 [Actinomortierella ambigua]|nr:hypothetical protein BGZ73_006048 [Actinomortierella ambigua]